MIHKHIKSLPHHPKRVIIISLIIAGAIGVWGYMAINKKISGPQIAPDSQIVSKDSSVHNLTLAFLASGRIKSVSVKAGDTVKAGQMLAELDAGNTIGAFTQAKASYATASANYQKVISGATGPTIDVAKTAVNNAKTNLEQVNNQQDTLVENAQRKLYSDGLIAQPDSDDQKGNTPVISGNYSGTEGDYEISFKDFNFVDIRYGGLEKGIAEFSTLPELLGTKGLFISFPNGSSGYRFTDSWTIHIPNKSGVHYTDNLNAYQLALQNKEQAVATAQSALDQANANLTSIITTARPEDVATAQAQMDSALGAVQIAQAAYNNTIITAPSDGTVTSVAITPGQISVVNAPAIEFISTTTN